jgi:hypothetical protein
MCTELSFFLPSFPGYFSLPHSPCSSHWSQRKEKRFEAYPICSDIKRCLALWKVVETSRVPDWHFNNVFVATALSGSSTVPLLALDEHAPLLLGDRGHCPRSFGMQYLVIFTRMTLFLLSTFYLFILHKVFRFCLKHKENISEEF